MDYRKFFSISIIKSVYFNFKYLPFKSAVKFPFLISRKVYLKDTKGKININHPLEFGLIKIGFGDVGIFDSKRQRTIWQNLGKVNFFGKANIGHGSKISVGALGVLSLGNNFNVTAETAIVAHLNISFGNDCLLSWETLVMDTDFHSIRIASGEQINNPSPIVVGDSVWIGCKCLILKGAIIPNGSIIGANTLVNKKLEDENAMYAGNPVVKLKDKITWAI